MPRPLRTEYPGAWHHVMNRGASGRNIFLDVNDRLVFLDLLAESSGRTKVEVHAYCLMSNHYHLLIRTPSEEMAAMMRLLGSSYAKYFNGRYGRDGGLCRGRYRSILIDSDQYLLAVSRYVHRNPLAFWTDPLGTYGWSSYPVYLGFGEAPEWLFTDETLRVIGGRDAYKSLVESPLPSEVDRVFEQRYSPAVLGSQGFKSSLKMPSKGNGP